MKNFLLRVFTLQHSAYRYQELISGIHGPHFPCIVSKCWLGVRFREGESERIFHLDQHVAKRDDGIGDGVDGDLERLSRIDFFEHVDRKVDRRRKHPDRTLLLFYQHRIHSFKSELDAYEDLFFGTLFSEQDGAGVVLD